MPPQDLLSSSIWFSGRKRTTSTRPRTTNSCFILGRYRSRAVLFIIASSIRSWPEASSEPVIHPQMCLVGFGASLLLFVLVAPSKSTSAFFLLPSRAWEMLTGSLVSLYAGTSRANPRLATIDGQLGMVLTVASMFTFDEGMTRRLGSRPSAGRFLDIMGSERAFAGDRYGFRSMHRYRFVSSRSSTPVRKDRRIVCRAQNTPQASVPVSAPQHNFFVGP
jgi:hypothetical protein